MVALLYHGALRAGVKPPLDLVKSNGRASRAADSSVSRWMSIEDCNTQSFPSVCSFYLAALALGFAWLRCIIFCFAKSDLSKSAQYLLWRSPRRALDQDARFGQIRMVENRATTGGRLVPTYTQKAHWTRNSINPPPPRLAAARRRSARTAGRSRTTGGRAASRGPRRRR